MGDDDDQALTTHAKKNRSKGEDRHHINQKYSKRIRDLKGTTPILDVSHVMRKATLKKIVLVTKDPLRPTRRRGIMHILLKMMNKQTKEQEKILQAMKNMS